MFTTWIHSAIAEFTAETIATALSDIQVGERGRPRIREHDDERDVYHDWRSGRRRPVGPPFPDYRSRRQHHHRRGHENFDRHHRHRSHSLPRCTCSRNQRSEPEQSFNMDSDLPFRPGTHRTRQTIDYSPSRNRAQQSSTPRSNSASPSAATESTCTQHPPPIPPKIPLSDSSDSETPITTPPDSPTTEPSQPLSENHSSSLLPIPTPHGILIWETDKESQNPRCSQRETASAKRRQPHARNRAPRRQRQQHGSTHHTHQQRRPAPSPSPSPTTKHHQAENRCLLHDPESELDLRAVDEMERLDALVTDASQLDLESRKEIVAGKKQLRDMDWEVVSGCEQGGEQERWVMSGGLELG
ncbi:MAG: hypothetical protein M1836_005438 [Candelina mexicana]|nr:MAG: hypothetical protein M1836_005438 [Candelina mexicana]